jgi:hypothetical protein
VPLVRNLNHPLQGLLSKRTRAELPRNPATTDGLVRLAVRDVGALSDSGTTVCIGEPHSLPHGAPFRAVRLTNPKPYVVDSTKVKYYGQGILQGEFCKRSQNTYSTDFISVVRQNRVKDVVENEPNRTRFLTAERDDSGPMNLSEPKRTRAVPRHAPRPLPKTFATSNRCAAEDCKMIGSPEQAQTASNKFGGPLASPSTTAFVP